MVRHTAIDLDAVAAAMLARGFSELLKPDALDDGPVAADSSARR